MGMHGTGSNDVVIQKQFVPEEYTFLLYDSAATDGPYNPRLVTTISWSLISAVALGIARRAMNAFVRMATESGSTTSPTLMRGRAPAQTTVGEAEAIISGSRAYVLNTVQGLGRRVPRRFRPSPSSVASKAGHYPLDARISAGC